MKDSTRWFLIGVCDAVIYFCAVSAFFVVFIL